MKSLKKIFFFLLLFAFEGYAQEQYQSPERILFVGNSYTYFWNLPQQVSEMAKSVDVDLITQQSTAGGSNLGQHWRSAKGLSSVDMIEEGMFDAVILQDHSLRPIEFPDSLLYYGTLLGNLIKEHGGQPYVYMTWARKNDPAKQQIISNKYVELAEKIHARIIPVGLAWEKAIEKNPGIRLYDDDGSHPSTVGTYLTACVFFSVLTNQSPLGLPHRLITSDKDGEKLYLNIQSEETARFCQEIADEVIRTFMD